MMSFQKVDASLGWLICFLFYLARILGGIAKLPLLFFFVFLPIGCLVSVEVDQLTMSGGIARGRLMEVSL